MANVKISELPADVALSGTAKHPVVDGGITSYITHDNLKAGLDYQPASDNLDTLSAITPSALGQNLLAKENPTGVRYIRVSTLGLPVYMTPAEVLADIAAQPLSANLTELSTLNPTLPGQNLLTLDPPSSSNPFYYIRISSGVDNDVFYRTPAQMLTDIGAFALASLSNDTNLGGGLPSSGKAPTQYAVQKYVDARLGHTLQEDSDDTIASAATLDLDSTIGTQIDVTGNAGITAITLAEGERKVLRFLGSPSMTAGDDLTIIGGSTKAIEPGDWMVVQGEAGDAAAVLEFTKADRSKTVQTDALALMDVDNGKFLTIIAEDGSLSGGDSQMIIVNPSSKRLDLTGGDLVLGGTLTTDNEFGTIGNFPISLTATAASSPTLPVGATTLEGRVAVPASAAAAGVAGQVAYDSNFEYRCVATNTWKRVAIATW